MTPLKQHYETVYQQMDQELIQIQANSNQLQQEAEQSIPVIRRYLKDIKKEILQALLTVEEEVYFFKFIKPRFYSQLIYYYKVLQSELGKPTAGKEMLIKYFNGQLSKLAYFFRKYDYFYRYYRSGANTLDQVFFVRGNPGLLPGVAAYGVDTDPSFTTGYDFIVAKMKANELLQVYLETELQKVQLPVNASANSLERGLSWTGSKAALIELLYALQGTGVLNNGAAALNEVAQFIENIFGIKLGNYYRVFQEIRIRKKSRTQFLDELKERLIQKMDYTDENPHVQ